MISKELKILLVMPPRITAERGFDPIKCSYAGLGLVHIASYLHKSGYEVEVIDLSSCNFFDETDIQKIRGFDVYGIGMYSESALSVEILCVEILKTNPNAKIIIGGHHITSEWKSVLSDHPFIYAAVMGDGEIPMKMLVDSIAEGSYKREFPGISYISQTGEYCNQGTYINHDLSEVEIDFKWLRKEYTCFSLLEYAQRLFPQHPVLLEKYLRRNLYHEDCIAAGIITSRGCNVRCSFCTFELSTGFTRHRIEYVSDLFEWCASNEIFNLIFYDSTFLSDFNHVEEMCKVMIRNKYNFKWTAQTQVHHKDKSIIKLMAEAGLVQMNLGLESGSPDVIRSMNKKFDIQEFPEIVESYQNAGVGVCANLIIGSPSEDTRTIKETCKVFYHVDTEVIGEVQDLKLYPGSRWYRKAINDGLISSEWNWKEKGIPRFVFHDEKEVERWRIIMEVHIRYASVFNKIKRNINNVAMVGFPDHIDTSFLIEAIHFAFPGCSVDGSLKPNCSNLVLCFRKESPKAAELKLKEDDELVWCSIEENAFKLEIS